VGIQRAKLPIVTAQEHAKDKAAISITITSEHAGNLIPARRGSANIETWAMLLN
jgi:hypothetical protein